MPERDALFVLFVYPILHCVALADSTRHRFVNGFAKWHHYAKLHCVPFAVAVAHGEQQLLRKFVFFGLFHADSDVYSITVAILHRRWGSQRHQHFFGKRLRNDFAIAELVFHSLAIFFW